MLTAAPLEPRPYAQLDLGEAIVEPDGSWRSAMELPESKVGRPVKYGPAHYAKVAEVYLLAERQGKHPRQAVMKYFGLTERTASRHIEKARDIEALRPKED